MPALQKGVQSAPGLLIESGHIQLKINNIRFNFRKFQIFSFVISTDITQFVYGNFEHTRFQLEGVEVTNAYTNKEQ